MCDAVNHESGHLPELAVVADVLPSALIIIDRQGRIVLANTLVPQVLRLSPDQSLENQSMWQALPPGIREIIATMQREVLIYGTEAKRDFSLNAPGSLECLLELQLSPVSGSNGHPEYFSLSITEARERQEIEELKKLDHLKSAFLAMISHELRTPLTSIRGAVHLLADNAGMTDDPGKTLVNIIQGNSERLIRLVNNMLEMVAIDNGNFMVTRSRTQIAPIIEAAILRNKPAAACKFLSVNYSGSVEFALVDPERFCQLINHLLDNAIKFTPHGGQIIVSTGIGDDASINLVVSDSGCGVPAHAREKIFDRFYQVEDPMTRCCGGAGVGLYLAHHIVQAHNGRLWVESNGSCGSDFHVLFPLAAMDAASYHL